MKKFTDKINESVENGIPTAEEFFSEDNGLYTAYSVKNKEGHFTSVCSYERAIEFAKMHVEAALKKASGDAHTIDVPYTDDVEVDKDSILKSYPLDNIK